MKVTCGGQKHYITLLYGRGEMKSYTHVRKDEFKIHFIQLTGGWHIGEKKANRHDSKI